MESNQLYTSIGKISYMFTSIDFLISIIAFNLEITKDPYEFLAEINFEKKIERLKKEIDNKVNDELKKELIEWLEELDQVRKKRNQIIHSIISKNTKDPNDYILFDYKKSKNKIIRDVVKFTSHYFTQLEDQLTKINNSGHIYLEEIKNLKLNT